MDPADLMKRLGADIHRYVVGGWALDLWHGRQTRNREDLEFALLPEDADRGPLAARGTCIFRRLRWSYRISSIIRSTGCLHHAALERGSERGVLARRHGAGTWHPATRVSKRDPTLNLSRNGIIRKPPTASLIPGVPQRFFSRPGTGGERTTGISILPCRDFRRWEELTYGCGWKGSARITTG